MGDTMPRAIRVVLDTNVLVSALLSIRGASNRILGLVGRGEFSHFVSVPLALEYEATLRRMLPTDRFSAEDIGAMIDYLCQTGERQEIFFLWRPLLTDPGDDMILELAVAGMCSHIVTFNLTHFSGAASFGITVIRPADFLSLLRGKS